ncbi:divalent cation transporter [Exilibacterium tricleocarpae]|uniref:Divalent cation transporter n=1 Tax=Exilibacterium tricleocarpae TaxID=2591008 RepID=A0A545SZ20_9GAMM|nr:divalent cation transporter [Exilibacterium tricleocarpae]TQV70207.1 divalent cation transporter [Exilibacterium tricleocarpae]
MEQVYEIIFYASLAGVCIPLGGALAGIERIRPQWLERELRHFVIAFGAGILVAAVGLVLVPEGAAYVEGDALPALYIVLGGVLFFLLESRMLARRKSVPQLLAMLLDYLPESIALGGMLALDARAAPLLAVLIGLQNLPEGFNSYRELRANAGLKPRQILLLMGCLALLGPVMGLLGWWILADRVQVLGAIMLVASGGILYLIFQDIAPQARLKRHWAPPLGAVCGFGLAMFGQLYIENQL